MLQPEVSYEARIGWRYLYGGKRDRLMLKIAGAFAVVTVVGNGLHGRHDLGGYKGLAKERPVLAFAFTIFLLMWLHASHYWGIGRWWRGKTPAFLH